MKQTNNAIKFLMAQYRAIYKHAYIKGILSASALTLGLVAGQAQAVAEVFDKSAIEGLSSASEIEINNEFSESGQFNDLNITEDPSSGTENILSVTINGTLSTGLIKDTTLDTSQADWHFNGKKSTDDYLLLQGNSAVASLTTKNTTVQGKLNVHASGANSTLKATEALSVSNGGTLKLTTEGAHVSTVEGLTINVGSTTAPASRSTATSSIILNGVADSKAILGKQDSGGSGFSKSSTINVGQDSKISVDASTAASYGNIVGATLNLSGTLATGGHASNVSSLKVSVAELNIGETAKINIGLKDTLDIALADLKYDDTNYQQTLVKVDKGATLTVTGTLNLKGATTNAAFDFSKATLKVGDASSDTTKIHVSGTSLILNQEQFQSFLKKETATEAVGNIVLSGESTLALLGDKELDLNDEKTIKFGQTLTDNSATKDLVGVVQVSGSATATIAAEKLKLTKALSLGDDAGTLSLEANTLTLGKTGTDGVASLSALGINGATAHEKLVLNTNNADGQFTIDKSIVLDSSKKLGDYDKGSYFVQDANGFNTTAVSKPTLIEGNATEFILTAENALSVQGGNWATANQDIEANASTATDAVLSITSSAAEQISGQANKYYNKASQAAFTMQGGNLILTKGLINISGAAGAGALLDLSQVDSVSFATGATKSGAFVVSGDASDKTVQNQDGTLVTNSLANGYGVLKVDGKKFLSPFVNKTSSSETNKNGTYAINLQNDGVLYVVNSQQGTYSFSDFGTTANTVGTVNFAGKGFAVFDSSLTLQTGDQKNPSTTGSSLDIGNGTLVADTITLNNYHRVSAPTQDNAEATKPDSVKIDAGKLIVHSGLNSSVNSDLIVGSGDGTNNANITLDGAGSLGFQNVTVKSGSKIKIESGAWTAQNIKLEDATSSGDPLTIGNSADTTSLVMQNLDVGAQNTIKVNNKASAQIQTINLASSAKLDIHGNVKLLGKTGLETTDPLYNQGLAGVNLQGANIQVYTGGQLAISSDILNSTKQVGEQVVKSISFSTTEGDNPVTTATIQDGLKANYIVDQGGELLLDFQNNFFGHSLTATEAAALKSALFTDPNENLKGILNLGQTELAIEWTPNTNESEVQWDKIADFANITGGDVTTEKLKNALVTDVHQNSQVSGQFGSIKADSDFLTGQAVQVQNDFGLHNAYLAKDGKKYYAFYEGARGTESLSLNGAKAADITLAGGGIIDAVSVNDAVLSVIGGGTTTFEGKVSVTHNTNDDAGFVIDDKSTAEALADVTSYSLDNHGVLNVKQGTLTISEHGWLDSYTGSAINTKNLVANSNITAMGDINVAEKLTLNSGLHVVDGNVSAKEVVVNQGAAGIQVGYEADETRKQAGEIFEVNKSYGGQFSAQKITLNGSSIYIDPSNGRSLAIASLTELSGEVAQKDKPLYAGTLDGDAYVGAFSVLGIGTTNSAELAKFVNENFTLSQDKESIGSLVYLDKSFDLATGKGLTLTAQNSEDFVKYYNSYQTKTDSKLNALSDKHVAQNTVFLGANTALVVSEDVVNDAETTLGLIGHGMINMQGADSKVIADGGEIVINGNVRANKTYQVFSQSATQNSYKAPSIITIDGSKYVITPEGDEKINAIEVSTLNHFLEGYVDQNGQVTLGINKDRALMSGASDPVYDTIIAYARGYNGQEGIIKEQASTPETAKQTTANQDPQKPYVVADSDRLYSYDKQGNKVYSYTNTFLQETIATGDGSAVEQVARLGAYAGVVQSALLSSTTTTDAISARMGVGAQQGNLNFADNTQGAALWVTPIYQSTESDGFAAQGVKYGVDADIFGVALGADYTLNNGLRVGLMFNVGSGDADGKQAAQGVKNDFDYYGFGAYAGYSMDKFSVVADLSYSVADNEITGSNSIEQVKSKLDSTALSLGVTGQYTLVLGGLNATPHAGLRFTSIDMDNYSIESAQGEVAHYSADRLNVFSIPVGISFSKDFVSGSWTVKPSLDLTITGNFGDDEAEGTVAWEGVENLTTRTNTEVFDNFTYGATVGVAAKTGNFSLGLGMNYTGSSNTDAFGLNANARFVF